jgi:TetR/AcrR family transcriptional repressor of mexJK operon
LASAFSQLTDRALLRIDEPILAANHFTWLVVSIPVNKVMFCGDDTQFTQAELDHYADTAVRVFTAAYRTTSGSTL